MRKNLIIVPHAGNLVANAKFNFEKIGLVSVWKADETTLTLNLFNLKFK